MNKILLVRLYRRKTSLELSLIIIKKRKRKHDSILAPSSLESGRTLGRATPTLARVHIQFVIFAVCMLGR